MPIQVYDVQMSDTGATPPPAPAAEGADSGVPGAASEAPATPQEPAGAPPAPPSPGSLGEEPGDASDDEPEAVTMEDFNRHMARMRRRQRTAERSLEAERTANREAQARMLGQIEALQRVMSGATPTMPEAQPQGPPQAEQYSDHDAYVDAKVDYRVQQQQAQQAQQAQAQAQDAAFKERYAAFAQDHPDLYERVQTTLVGKVAPHVEQALAMLPEGPALAYALTSQPETVQRLNTLPPPQMLFALAQVMQGIPQAAAPTAPQTTNGAAPTTPAPAALPPPLTPVSGQGSAPSGVYREGMTQAEFRALRARTSQLSEWTKHRNGA